MKNPGFLILGFIAGVLLGHPLFAQTPQPFTRVQLLTEDGATVRELERPGAEAISRVDVARGPTVSTWLAPLPTTAPAKPPAPSVALVESGPNKGKVRVSYAEIADVDHLVRSDLGPGESLKDTNGEAYLQSPAPGTSARYWYEFNGVQSEKAVYTRPGGATPGEVEPPPPTSAAILVRKGEPIVLKPGVRTLLERGGTWRVEKLTMPAGATLGTFGSGVTRPVLLDTTASGYNDLIEFAGKGARVEGLALGSSTRDTTAFNVRAADCAIVDVTLFVDARRKSLADPVRDARYGDFVFGIKLNSGADDLLVNGFGGPDPIYGAWCYDNGKGDVERVRFVNCDIPGSVSENCGRFHTRGLRITGGRWASPPGRKGAKSAITIQDDCDDVLIEGVAFVDSAAIGIGPIVIHGGSQDGRVGRVTIRNCTGEGVRDISVRGDTGPVLIESVTWKLAPGKTAFKADEHDGRWPRDVTLRDVKVSGGELFDGDVPRLGWELDRVTHDGRAVN